VVGMALILSAIGLPALLERAAAPGRALGAQA
jgi:hypothetical protein